MSDVTQVYGKPTEWSAIAGATITGGQALAISADNTVIPAGVNGVVIGIAGHDATTGAAITVKMGAGVIWDLTSSGAIAFGAPVYAGAAGVVTATAGTGPIAGYALKAAAANVCRVKMVA